MLDKIPAPARHLAIVILASFVGGIINAVLAAGGVTDLDWARVLVDDLNATAVAAATAVAGLWLTPLTRQYGVGAAPAGDR